MQPVNIHLANILQKILSTHFEVDHSFAQIQKSDRPDLADYQTNCALVLAKQLKTNPRALAEQLIAHWPKDDPTHITIAGPGFINFKLTDQQLVSTLNQQVSSTFTNQEVANQTIVFDYGGPNVAKPMHVGHLRSSIIGECLKRLYQFAGAKVIADIHLGDWGTQMGMLIVGLHQQHPDWPYFNQNHIGPYPQQSPITLADLETLYPKISAACKEDSDLAEKCRIATQELQQGRPGYLALWQHFIDVSISAMKKEFNRLGVSFDCWFGESRYQEKLQPLVDLFRGKKVAEICDGATIVEVEEPSDNKPMPPVILQKKDGGFLYATTDLATIDERIQDFKADQIIYVVDNRQALHFEQIFRAAEKIGWHVPWTFVGFGTMNGPDGKPFKTRAGGVMKLKDLIDTLTATAKERLLNAERDHNFSDQERQQTAEQIGLAALKFADLQHDPKQNYQFDIDKFMRFEGKTGPYLQYAAVRIKSLLAKADLNTEKTSLQLPSSVPNAARDLLLHLIRLPEVLNETLKHNSPNILCEAAFQLAQAFSRFYNEAPVLTETDSALKEFKLRLCQQTYKTLKVYLDIIGIDIPARM
tara:strand:+ start:58350 stop:60107 length:1758 start_codon:yes stop_codon:yes gene_type:complete